LSRRYALDAVDASSGFGPLHQIGREIEAQVLQQALE
jgi:hypothetical protein